MRKIHYKEISNIDLESLALILTDTGHAEDITIEFIMDQEGKAEIRIRILEELDDLLEHGVC